MLFKEEDMKTLFNLIDLRKMGTVTKDQVENCLLNVKFEKDTITSVFQSFSNLGRINQETFVKIMQQIVEKSKLNENYYL